MDMLDRVLSFFILMHVLQASLLIFFSSHSTVFHYFCLLLCSLSALLSLFSAPARLSVSTYLSLPPIGLNSSSTLCFYMKPEHH